LIVFNAFDCGVYQSTVVCLSIDCGVSINRLRCLSMG
jgi:hypothetical protein